MSKSVVIIGKGPSVLDSTREFIESFDEVAICNFPPIEGYEQYIGQRASYHFLNVHDPHPYGGLILNSLGLKYMFNTHPVPIPGKPEIFPKHPVVYYPFYGKEKISEFKEKYDFPDPSCGTMAFEYFVCREEFDTIGLVGFDFFKVGERGYYYPPSQVQKSLKYLYRGHDQTFVGPQGIRRKAISHDSVKSESFVEEMIKKYNKKLRKPTSIAKVNDQR